MAIDSRRRAALASVLVPVVAAVPASAADDDFSDVPGSNTHHDAISELSDAGVTAGCDDGRYCPGEDVSRDQMASFLTRGGSSVSADASSTVLTAGDGGVSGAPVAVDVTAPGVGGRQNVLLQGTVTVLGDGAVDGCPCDVEAFVYPADDERVQGPSSWTVLAGEATGSETTSVSLPVSWSVPQASGETEEYVFAVFVDGTDADDLEADGALSALTAPFGDVPAP